jgi:hypothetical protein
MDDLKKKTQNIRKDRWLVWGAHMSDSRLGRLSMIVTTPLVSTDDMETARYSAAHAIMCNRCSEAIIEEMETGYIVERVVNVDDKAYGMHVRTVTQRNQHSMII